jgi:predicted kinase
MLYGFPGAGKTHFARQLCTQITAAHVQDERIRGELFESPKYDKNENGIVTHLMDYMAEEFLRAGISVVYDTNAMRLAQRRVLRDMARRTKAGSVLIWLQIDSDTALQRVLARDRRKSDDKYAMPLDKDSFQKFIGSMQNPGMTEDYIVISGKHTFNTQKSAVLKRLYELRMLSTDSATAKVIKPELVNLIPHKPIGGRVDMTRRNIVIR